MRVINAFLDLFLWAFVTAAGFFILFSFWWNHDNWRYLGIAGFALVIAGIFYCSFALLTILMPARFKFSKAILTDAGQRLEFQMANGKLTTLWTGLYLLLFISLIIGSAVGFSDILDGYKAKEIREHGQKQRVCVLDISYLKGHGQQVEFEYLHNGNTYHGRFKQTNENIGDSVMIIFSSHRPEIVVKGQ